MSSIADRLRGIVRPGGPGGSQKQDPPCGVEEKDPAEGSRRRRPGPVDPAGGSADAAEILDGEWKQAGTHRFLVVQRTYAPGHRHGAISVADSLPPDEGWSRLALLAGTPCGGNLLFVDLETTGLGGGAGRYALLSGCGWFKG